MWRGRAGAPTTADSKRALGQHYARTAKGEAVFDDAIRWQGWGTALKPAHEPIALARKPLRGTVMANVLAHGTGALNIDATKIGNEVRGAAFTSFATCHGNAFGKFGTAAARRGTQGEPQDYNGRWPANVITDGTLDVVEAFPGSARDAIRFFYSPKADRAERDSGLRDSGLRDSGVGALRDSGRGTAQVANFHPTVKPIDLMRWLVRLIAPPVGIVLDPFMGSGTTGIAAVREGKHFIGIERDPDYFEIARKRIAAAVEQAERVPDLLRAMPVRARQSQADLFAI